MANKNSKLEEPLHCFRLYPKKNLKRSFERIDFEFGEDFKAFERYVKELLSNTEQFKGFSCPEPFEIHIKKAKRDTYDQSNRLNESNYLDLVKQAERNYGTPHIQPPGSEPSDTGGKERIIIYVWMVNNNKTNKKSINSGRSSVSLPQKISPSSLYTEQPQQTELTGISVGLDPMQFGSDIGVQMGGIFDDSLGIGIEKIPLTDQNIGIQLQGDFQYNNNLESGNIESPPKYIELEGVTVLIPVEALRRIPKRYLKFLVGGD